MAITREEQLRAAQRLLDRNRRDAYQLAAKKGQAQTKELMENAAKQLRERLANIPAGMEDSFTANQASATLRQIETVTQELSQSLGETLVGEVRGVARISAEDTLDYLARVDRAHKGLGEQGLAIKEASMLDRATQGAQSTTLRRLAGTADSPEGYGILARYGTNVIGQFEEVLQTGLLAKQSWGEMRDALVSKSPFLQGSPMFWAERIVRTEIIGAYNRAGWESVRAADDELGDMVKIVAATFDDRTGADSIALHGQIRRVDEPFEWWGGKYMHPPNRPNDREIVVPHRVSWEIPEYLQWRSDGEVMARWKKDKRKGSPPPRPLMTTIPLSRFGTEEKKPMRTGGQEPMGE